MITRGEWLILGNEVGVDTLRFRNHLASREYDAAVRTHRAPFLDAFFLDGEEFDSWAARERARLRSELLDAFESLATTSESQNDFAVAVNWWRAFCHEDPYNTRAVMRLMLAMERAGDHGNAIEIAIEHRDLLWREMESEPTIEFGALLQRIRERPNGVLPPATMADLAGTQAVAAASVPPATNLRSAPAGRSARRVRFLSLTAVLLTVVVTALVALRPQRYDAASIFVGDFRNETGESRYDALNSGLRDLIHRDLSQWSLVRIAQASTARSGLLTWFSRPQRAGIGIDGRYGRAGDSIRIDARLVDVRQQRLLRGLRVTIPIADVPTDAAEELSDRTMGALAMILDERFSGVVSADHSAPRFNAYLEFMIGLELHAASCGRSGPRPG